MSDSYAKFEITKFKVQHKKYDANGAYHHHGAFEIHRFYWQAYFISFFRNEVFLLK
jgi:hypothetical protein